MKTKKEVIKYLSEQILLILPKELEISKSTIISNALKIKLKNDAKIKFSFQSIMAGTKGKNTFVIKFSMMLYDDNFAKIISQPTGYDLTNNNKDLILSLNSANNLPKEWNVYERYMFDNEEDRFVTAARLVEDIKKYFIPFCVPFLKNYNLLLDSYQDYEFLKQTFLNRWKHFAIAVTCALLTKRENEIEEIIVPLANKVIEKDKQNNISFYSFAKFKEVADYKKEIIEPIKKYMEENNLIGIYTNKTNE